MPSPPAPPANVPLPARRRILVMRYRFIGDTLLTVPFLRNLRAAYPEATIDVLVGPNSGELLAHCPYVNELICYDTTRKHRYENPQEGAQPRQTFWSYVQLLKSRRYDTAFVLKRSFSAAGLAWLAGIPERIGFDTEGRGFLLTRRVSYNRGGSEVECFLDVLRAANVPVTDNHLEAWWRDADLEKASRLLAPWPGHHVVLHLSSSNRAKQWPDASGRALAEWLLSRPQTHVHCLGAASDRVQYEAIQAQLPAPLGERLHIHCGQLALNESMAFLSRMQGVVGVDSGTLHMAAAVGIPVVALFGPMSEAKWAPAGAHVVTEPVACRPCNLDRPCRFDFQCMQQLSVEKVKAACQTHWSY